MFLRRSCPWLRLIASSDVCHEMCATDDVDGEPAWTLSGLCSLSRRPTFHNWVSYSSGMLIVFVLMRVSKAVYATRRCVLCARAGERDRREVPLFLPAVARMTHHIMTPLL